MGTVDLVIKNAKVYFNGNLIEGGIAADEGSIVSVGRETYLPRADRTIEAKGRVLIPGAIDGHVHIREP
ncbi:MAG: allantoinase, partial [Candidatus Bathyarchaeia archaeon]